jgi:hypothetical protein
VIITGDMPPICSQMDFHVHPFSRLMSRIFSVRSLRFMNDILVSRAEQPRTDFATHVPFACAGATLLSGKISTAWKSSGGAGQSPAPTAA